MKEPQLQDLGVAASSAVGLTPGRGGPGINRWFHRVARLRGGSTQRESADRKWPLRLLAGLITAATMVGATVQAAQPAAADPACAMRLTVASGSDDLRSGSALFVRILTWVGDSTGSWKWISLDTNGDQRLSASIPSRTEHTFWVAPTVRPDSRGYRCVDGEAIFGAEVYMSGELVGGPFFIVNQDEWDMARFTLSDSVSGRVYWDSRNYTTPLAHFKPPRTALWSTINGRYSSSVPWTAGSGPDLLRQLNIQR